MYKELTCYWIAVTNSTRTEKTVGMSPTERASRLTLQQTVKSTVTPSPVVKEIVHADTLVNFVITRVTRQILC